jgi:K+-transporting ATPase A subunit
MPIFATRASACRNETRGVMTVVGWLQIALFMAAIGLFTRPLGGYLAHVYGGQHTLLQPIIAPIERMLYSRVRIRHQ